jgi:hypothetical protein
LRTERRAPFIVQVVPPGHGGVRDHASVLQSLWQRAGLEAQTIELDLYTASTRSLGQRLQDLQDDSAQPCALLLHFSGYGYHRRGLCRWLLLELQAAQGLLGPRLRVVTLFHELFASGPPWRSAFWLGHWQANIARHLARLSDAVVTNSEHHAAWLRRLVAATERVHVQPVFSNIGEPAVVRAVRERTGGLVIFGSASTRDRALQRLPAYAAALHDLGVTGIVEVGPGAPASSLKVDFVHTYLGRLLEAEIGALLQTCRYGLIDYPSVHLGKSGVFAAYAAHGCVVLNTALPGPDADGLLAGRHYISLPRAASRAHGDAADQTSAAALRSWYAGHTAIEQAADLAALLGCPPPS